MLYIPRRVIVASCLWLVMLAAYTMRIVTSVPIVEMAAQENWSPAVQGLFLSSFYWGYIFLQLPGAWLSNRYGSKAVIGIGFSVAALSTAAIPLLAPYLSAVVALRFVCGLGEAATFPAAFNLITQWFPKTEKSTAAAAIPTGTYVGIVYGMGINPLVVGYLGWQWTFYITAIVTAVVLVPWFLFMSDSPLSDGFSILKPSVEETNIIFGVHQGSESDRLVARQKQGVNTEDGYGSNSAKVIPATSLRNQSFYSTESFPFRAIFTSMAVWALIFNHFASNWTLYVFSSWLPTYLSQVLNYQTSNGIILMIPYLLNPVVGTLAGFLSDKLVRGNKIRQLCSAARKIFQCSGLLLSAALLLIVGYADLPPLYGVICLSGAITCMGMTAAGYQGNHIDLSPKYASILWGITNTFATLPGIIGVYITGFILQMTDENWRIVFLVAASVNTLASLVYAIFASSDQIDFDRTF